MASHTLCSADTENCNTISTSKGDRQTAVIVVSVVWQARSVRRQHAAAASAGTWGTAIQHACRPRLAGRQSRAWPRGRGRLREGPRGQDARRQERRLCWWVHTFVSCCVSYLPILHWQKQVCSFRTLALLAAVAEQMEPKGPFTAMRCRQHRCRQSAALAAVRVGVTSERDHTAALHGASSKLPAPLA